MGETSLIEYELDRSTFMGAWYIDPRVCEALIDYFEANQDKEEGTCGNSQGEPHVDKSIKDSTDIHIKADNIYGIVGIYRQQLQKVLECYIEKYPEANKVEKFNIKGQYNMQKYPVSGGFKKWHAENNGNNLTGKRHLVFMTYLNDVKNGGTEFLYQNVVTPCEKGLTLIWPAGWTHYHRGVVSEFDEKYIVTGWYEFE